MIPVYRWDGIQINSPQRLEIALAVLLAIFVSAAVFCFISCSRATVELHSFIGAQIVAV